MNLIAIAAICTACMVQIELSWVGVGVVVDSVEIILISANLAEARLKLGMAT